MLPSSKSDRSEFSYLIKSLCAVRSMHLGGPGDGGENCPIDDQFGVQVSVHDQVKKMSAFKYFWSDAKNFLIF